MWPWAVTRSAWLFPVELGLPQELHVVKNLVQSFVAWQGPDVWLERVEGDFARRAERLLGLGRELVLLHQAGGLRDREDGISSRWIMASPWRRATWH